MKARARAALAALATALGCNVPGTGPQPIFVDGRAVTPVGDTLLAMTRSGGSVVLLRDQRKGTVRPMGQGVLHGPLQVQWNAGRWYVSDVDDGHRGIVEFSADGKVVGRVALDSITLSPHQFAVLPNGRIVVESDHRLVAISDSGVTTFARTDTAQKPGLLVGASGGVLYALPDKSITLYNAFGNVRWRIDWPWKETAFVSDLSVDAAGRLHVIAGVPSEGKFIVYSINATNGEIVRWSTPGPYATFVVDKFGKLEPDSAADWAG